MHSATEAGREVSKEDQAWADAWETDRAYLVAQMHDLSLFMKSFKQRFSSWFNKTHGSFGRLWADRFKSQLVEDRSTALQIVAAYIDLNGVRTGLADDPKDYRFCGYAEAVSGNGALQGQLAGVMAQEAVAPRDEASRGPKSDLGSLLPLGASVGTAVAGPEFSALMAKYRLWLVREGREVAGIIRFDPIVLTPLQE